MWWNETANCFDWISITGALSCIHMGERDLVNVAMVDPIRLPSEPPVI